MTDIPVDGRRRRRNADSKFRKASVYLATEFLSELFSSEDHSVLFALLHAHRISSILSVRRWLRCVLTEFLTVGHDGRLHFCRLRCTYFTTVCVSFFELLLFVGEVSRSSNATTLKAQDTVVKVNRNAAESDSRTPRNCLYQFRNPVLILVVILFRSLSCRGSQSQLNIFVVSYALQRQRFLAKL